MRIPNSLFVVEFAVMDTVKFIVAQLLSPLAIALCLQLFGWILLWKRRNRLALFMLGFGTVVLLVGGMSGLTYRLRQSGEWIHRPIQLESLATESPPLIVVLGTGFNADPELPANCQVSSGFLARLLEGVRIHRHAPMSTLIVSVAGDATDSAKLQFLSDMVTLLALDEDHVDVILDAESTADEAESIAERYPGRETVVVTSAWHMSRASTIFQDAGLQVLEGPAEYYLPRPGSPNEKHWPRWVPSTDGINSNHQWMYETVAKAWHTVSGK